ncbi:hypothetical protein BDY21DRAFT_280067 [Lineolata rhizophorae]|uniref:Uncharacterized protein n=1 Tax=Lineolata rhizophorae TaxID=578093 RepID=A0A6A6P8T0_9PEZI|nr:hypothetical protein BDY21DRAFT_280067 [Lineolata rhizophorae]
MGTSPKSEFVHRQSPRPELKSRHTAEGVPKSQSSSTRPASSALRRVETASPAPPIKSRKLPPCPRPDYTSRYDFWYTLYGMPTLNICPDCLDNIVAGTPFIKYFERQMRRHPDEKTRCDFSAHWIRIAWVLTLERELSNLNLIYEVAEIMASEQECPGNRESYRSWYVLPADYHSSTEKLPPFHICSFDMRIVEALLPSFRGFFERARPPLASSPTDSNSHEKRLCSLRIQSPHFTTFFDALVAADDDAQYRSAMQRRSGGGSSPLDPDLRPKNKSSTSRRECPRDDVLVLDAPWHTIPGLPEFTVCEACFAEVVYPDIAAGSPLAAKMSSSARPVPAITIDSRSGGGTTVVEGHSCQLYSPRMRHVWRCAVQDEDLGYLVRKARERRKVETVLTARYKGLMRRVEAKGGFAAMEGSVEAEQLKAKIRDVLTDWKNWE